MNNQNNNNYEFKNEDDIFTPTTENTISEAEHYFKKHYDNKIAELEAIKVYQNNNRRSFVFALIIYIIMFYVLIYFFQMILGLIYTSLFDLPLTIEGSQEYTFDASAFIGAWLNVIIYILTTTFVVIILRKTILQDLRYFKYNIGKSIGLAFVGMLVMYGCNIVVNILLSFVIGIDGTSANQESINQLVLGDYFILIAIATVILAPILEELIYRKALFSILQPRFKSVQPVIFISGTIFGLIHVMTAIIENIVLGTGTWSVLAELAQGIPYVTMGIVFGYIYQHSRRRIMPVILLHALNNLIALLSTLLLANLDEYMVIFNNIMNFFK